METKTNTCEHGYSDDWFACPACQQEMTATWKHFVEEDGEDYDNWRVEAERFPSRA